MEYWILITGASSGIGYELALQWASKNHKVIVLARNREKLNTLKKHFPDKIHPIEFDLTNFHEYENLVNQIKEVTHFIDVLINNAGHLVNKPYSEMTYSDFDNISNINYKAPYFLSQKLVPLIKASQKKDIINIGSVGGVQNTDKFPGLSIYSSSKGAISILTECLAKELSSSGITINCLALGAVQTEMLEKAFPGYIPQLTPDKMAKIIIAFILGNDHIVSGKTIQIANSEV